MSVFRPHTVVSIYSFAPLGFSIGYRHHVIIPVSSWRGPLLTHALVHEPSLQITIPAMFMLLLVWIKTTTRVFDSPVASYTCGQTFPWQYQDRLDPETFEETPLFRCLQKPASCEADNYYRDEGEIFEDMGLEGVSCACRVESPPPCGDILKHKAYLLAASFCALDAQNYVQHLVN